MVSGFVGKIRASISDPVDAVGLSGLYLFASAAWLSMTLAEAGLIILSAAMPVSWLKGRSRLLVTPLDQYLVLFAAYVVLSAFVAAVAFPETMDAQWAYAWKWSSLLFILPCAFWIRGDEKRVLRLLLLSYLGLGVSVAVRSDWMLFPLWLQGQRYCFGFTCLTLALLAAVSLLGAYCFLPRMVSALERVWHAGRRAEAAFLGIFACAAFLMTIQVFITTQSRGVWLFFILVLASLILVRSVYGNRRLGGGLKSVFAGAVVVAVLIAVIWFEKDVISGRVQQEWDRIVEAVSSLDPGAVPCDISMGIRFHAWRLGLRAWTAAPVFGWGPGTDIFRFLMKQPDAFPVTPEERAMFPTYATHLHNDLIEALVRLGLVGAAFLMGAYLLVFHGLWKAARKGEVPGDLFLFLCSSLVICALFSMIDFRIVHVDYRHLVILIGSSAHTLASFHAQNYDASCLYSDRLKKPEMQGAQIHKG